MTTQQKFIKPTPICNPPFHATNTEHDTNQSQLRQTPQFDHKWLKITNMKWRQKVLLTLFFVWLLSGWSVLLIFLSLSIDTVYDLRVGFVQQWMQLTASLPRSLSKLHDPAEIIHHSIVVNNNSNSVVWRGPAFTFWPLLKAYLCAGQNPVQATQCVWKRTVLGTDLLTEYDTCHHAVVLTLSCLLLATVYCTVTVTPVPRITAAGKREKPLYTRDPRS